MQVPKTTIQDIAKALKITPSTVSRALNNHVSISEATKKAVTEKAASLNYSHNRIASSLRLGKTNILGVIIPSVEISFFGSVVHGIEKVAKENGYSILIFQSNEHEALEKEGVETFLHSRVDGILVSVSKETINHAHFSEIRKRNVPLILFDRVNDELGFPSVSVDDRLGAFKATQHLIEQGCTRIAHIGGQQHVAIFKKRLQGYLDALTENGLPVDEELIKFGSLNVESGKDCMRQLLLLSNPPDGVFAVEDFTALGAILELKQCGKKIPEELAIIGFANAPFSDFITPSLSTVDQQAKLMGEEAAKLFFQLSSLDTTSVAETPRLVLEPLLIQRESSCKKVAEKNK